MCRRPEGSNRHGGDRPGRGHDHGRGPGRDLVRENPGLDPCPNDGRVQLSLGVPPNSPQRIDFRRAVVVPNERPRMVVGSSNPHATRNVFPRDTNSPLPK